jgi:hypothetical protein
MTVQVVSDVAAAASPSLPPVLRTFYNAVVVLQFQGVLLPPACTGAYPFESEVITMAAALALWLPSFTIYYIVIGNGVWARRARFAAQVRLAYQSL